ncbi:type II toxin-antitoxin system PemK/MazF family toxin [Meiothermus sp.]|uniref:type II toxin-antitoxin system PemK/MazF family toxin n=1 Tax=Meiothermus sp. TaxID=1955249 RepID=UPI00307DC607
MRRGDIYLADLEPTRGSEANKRRPVVIVSNDESNEVVEQMGAGMVTVVPLSTNTERIYNFQVFLPAEATGLSQDSKAQAEQIRAISTNRISRLIGHVPEQHMQALDAALRLHLAL